MEENNVTQPSNNNEEKPKKTFWQKTKQHAKYKYVEASEKRKLGNIKNLNSVCNIRLWKDGFIRRKLLNGRH